MAAIWISGFDGVSEWPDIGLVVHSLPESDVVVSSTRIHVGDAVILSGTSIYSVFLAEEEGRIVVPSTAFAGGLEDRLKIHLRIGNVVLPGYLFMLPQSESEDFPNGGFINSSGQLVDNQNYQCTDDISVDGVVDIACKVLASGAACGLYGYNSEKQPVRVLIENSDNEIVHIIPDGTYSYIRATNAVRNVDKSLILYFQE